MLIHPRISVSAMKHADQENVHITDQQSCNDNTKREIDESALKNASFWGISQRQRAQVELRQIQMHGNKWHDGPTGPESQTFHFLKTKRDLLPQSNSLYNTSFQFVSIQLSAWICRHKPCGYKFTFQHADQVQRHCSDVFHVEQTDSGAAEPSSTFQLAVKCLAWKRYTILCTVWKCVRPFNDYFLYQDWCVVILFIFFCSWRIPYIKASAEGGHPGHKNSILSIAKAGVFDCEWLQPAILKLSFVSFHFCHRQCQFPAIIFSQLATNTTLTWHINVDRNHSIAASQHWVRIVIITAAVRAAPHRNHPPRLTHLIVHLPMRNTPTKWQ